MVCPIFDRSAYKRNLFRFRAKSNSDNFIYNLAEELTQEIIDDITVRFEKAFLYNPLGYSSIKIDSKKVVAGLLPPAEWVLDEEDMLLEANSFDLIISTLSLHLINDLPRVISCYYQALRPQGLFVATVLGGRTFQQLRYASLTADQALYGGVYPRVMPTINPAIVPGLLQKAGFAIPIVSSEIHTVYYENFSRLLQDIRQIGHSNCLIEQKKGLDGKNYLALVEGVYREEFEDAGKLPNDFEILIMMGAKN